MKRSIAVATLVLSIFTTLLECNNATNISNSTIPAGSNSAISQTEKKDSPTADPTIDSSPYKTTIEFTQPDETKGLLEDATGFIVLNADAFIEALRVQTTKYDMCKWDNLDESESNEKHFESYALENILGNAYITISRTGEDRLSDIYLECNRGTLVYYYVVSVLVSINEDIDYEKIVKSLGITETDEEEPGLHVLQEKGMDIVFERKEDRCTLSVMFYR